MLLTSCFITNAMSMNKNLMQNILARYRATFYLLIIVWLIKNEFVFSLYHAHISYKTCKPPH